MRGVIEILGERGYGRIDTNNFDYDGTDDKKLTKGDI